MITKSLQTILNAASVWGEKGKESMKLIKSWINLRVEKALERYAIKDLKGIALSDQKL